MAKYRVTEVTTFDVIAESEDDAIEKVISKTDDDAFGLYGGAVRERYAEELEDDKEEGASEDDDEDDDLNTCSECEGRTDDGEGWNGMCGNCADRAFKRRGE